MFLFASIAAPGRCSPSSLFVIFVLVVTFFFCAKQVQTQFSPRSALSKEFVCNYGIASNIANQQIDVWSVKNLLYLQLNRLVRSAPNGQLSAKLDNPFINNNNVDDDNADGDGNYDVDGNAVWERHLAIYNTRFKRFVKHIAFNETSPILAIYDHTRPVHLNDSIPITDVIESYLIRSDLTNVVINPLSVLYFESRSSLRHYCHNDWFYDEQSSRFCRRHPVVTDLDRVLAFGSPVTVDNVNTVHYALFRSSLLRADSVEECSVRSVSRISVGQVRDSLKHYVSASILSLQAGQQTISARNSRQNIRYMFSNKLGLFISWFVTPTTSYEYLENDEWFLMENCAVLMAVKLLPSIKICSKQGRFVSFFEVDSSIYALMSDHHRVIELTHDYLKKQYRLHNNFNIDVDQLKSDQFFNKFFGCVYNPYQAITTPTTISQPETVGHGHRSGPRPTRRPHPQRHHGHHHSSVSSRNESSVQDTSLKSTSLSPSPVNNVVHKVAKRSIFDYSNLDQQLKQVAEADLPRSYNYDGSPFMIQERGAFAGAGSEHSSSWWYLVIVIVFIILCCLAFLIMCCVYKKEKPLEEDDESKRRMVSGNEKVAGTFGLPILRQGHFKPSGKYGSLLFDKGSSPLLGKRTPSRLSHVNKIRDLNYKRGGAGAVAHAISLHDDTVTFTNKTTKVTKTTTVMQDDDEIVKFVGKIPADLLRKEDKILQSLKHRKSNTSNRSNRSIKSNCSAGVPHQGSNASNRSNKSNQSTKTNASIKSNVSQKGSNSSTQTNATIKIISAKTTNAVLKAKSARSTKTRGSVKTRGSIKSGHYSIKSSKPTTLATHNASKTGSLKSAKPMAQMQPLLSQPSTTTTVSTKSSKPMALPLPPLLPSASKTGSVKSSKPKPMPMGTFRHLSKATMFSRKHHASKTGSMKSAKPGVLPGPPSKVSADLPAPASQQHSSTVDSSVVSSSVNQSSAPGSQQQSSAADSSMSSSAASSTGPAPLSHQSSAAESTMSSNMSSSSSAPPSQASHTSGSTNKSSRPMALPQPSHTSGSTNKSARPMALPHPSHTGGSKTKSARPMAMPQPSQTSGSSTKSSRPMALQLPSHTSGATTRTRPVALPMPASVCSGPKEKSSSSNATLQTRKTMAQMNKQMASKRLSKYGKSMSKRAPSAHRSNVLPSAGPPQPPPPPQTITTTIITTTIIKKPIENQGSQTSGESSSAASSASSAASSSSN